MPKTINEKSVKIEVHQRSHMLRFMLKRRQTAGRSPVVAIFCKEMKLGGEPFTSDYYWQAYQDQLLALKKQGIEAYFVTDNNSYQGDGVFNVAYTTNHKTSIQKLQAEYNVKVDLVFDRGGFIGRDVQTINPALLLKIGNNKIEMYRYFGAFQPLSAICRTRKEIKEAFGHIPGDKVVVKEPVGQGGKEVYIGEKFEVLNQLPDTLPVLVQEFMDTSAGVPGCVSGVHDVRLSVCGGKIIGYYIRTAKAGSFHSNVSRGGTMKFYDVKEVPHELHEAVQSIDEFFQAFPRYYAIDFMHTPKGWKLVELNPYLALLPETDGPEARKTSAALTNYLAAEARKSMWRSNTVSSSRVAIAA